MANIPQSFFSSSPFGGSTSSAQGAAGTQASKDRKMASAEQLVLDLIKPDLRENALLELSKKGELLQDLAPLLWNSFGTIAALLQEIVSVYPVLSPPNLTPAQSIRVCNALAFLQCVASHLGKRMLFLNDNPRACDALRSCLPDMLRVATFSACLREHPTTRRWLQQLLPNVGLNRVPALQPGTGFDHIL